MISIFFSIIILSFHARIANLYRSLPHYSRCPSAHSIFLLWNDPDHDFPSELLQTSRVSIVICSNCCFEIHHIKLVLISESQSFHPRQTLQYKFNE